VWKNYKHGSATVLITRRKYQVMKSTIQIEYNFYKTKEVKNPYPKRKKKFVGINLSVVVK
jgi:hypothetical protein